MKATASFQAIAAGGRTHYCLCFMQHPARLTTSYNAIIDITSGRPLAHATYQYQQSYNSLDDH
jgi:hypothetical protein